MGKNKLILKKAHTQTNPMEIYRKKMRDKEKQKNKEKRHNKPESNRKPLSESANSLLETVLNSKNQITSINPDLISEDIDSYQTLFQRKNIENKPINETFQKKPNEINTKNDFFQKKQPNNQNKRPKQQSNQFKSSDPFYLATVQENYDPKKPVPTPKSTLPLNLGFPRDENEIFFQRNPLSPEKEGIHPIFNTVIQKEPELKGKSKVDVTKEKTFFIPSVLKNKPSGTITEVEKKYGSIRNISNVPAPAHFLSISVENNNVASFQKLSSFLDEINNIKN